MPVNHNNVDDVFMYHPPEGDQVERYQRLRDAAKVFARVALDVTPQSADQQAGMRHLREAVMTFNAAIALQGQV